MTPARPDRHRSHPSEQCDCPTCYLEHSCDCLGGSCDCAEYEIAVNPASGLIVAFTVDSADRPRVELVGHCPTTGKVYAAAKTFDDWAEAVDAFHRHADWQPTVVEWP